MRHHHEAAPEAYQMLLEQPEAYRVEVVGGLVKQHTSKRASRTAASASRAACPPERPEVRLPRLA